MGEFPCKNWQLFNCNYTFVCFQVPSGALLNKTIPGKYEDGEYTLDKCSMHEYNNQTNAYSNKTGERSLESQIFHVN